MEARPVVRLTLDTPAPRLDWFPIIRYNKYGGELLAAFELLLVSPEPLRERESVIHTVHTYVHTYRHSRALCSD